MLALTLNRGHPCRATGEGEARPSGLVVAPLSQPNSAEPLRKKLLPYNLASGCQEVGQPTLL